MLRRAVGIDEESHTYEGPECAKTVKPARSYVYTKRVRRYNLKVPYTETKTIRKNSPEKIIYHETKKSLTLPISKIKEIRAEKLSGDGKIQYTIENETASISFVSNGPNKL